MVSVIVPTFGRDQVLCETLDSLFAQDYERSEIIVVDQSSSHSDETRNYLNRNSGKFVYETLTQPSLANALNRGIQRARGEIIVLLDDDVVASPSLLSAHVSEYTDESVGATAGQVLEIGEIARPRQSVGTIDRSMNITQEF